MPTPGETAPASAPAPMGDEAEPAAAPTTTDAPPESVATASDWLDRICPYLLSEDGTYRSTQPDAGHRCMAQDPPSVLPTAFQERFCLTERHVRCEMFKMAEHTRESALGQEGIPPGQLTSARFRPSVRSIPLALGPSRDGQVQGGGDQRRRLIAAAIGVAVVAVMILFVILALGGSGDPAGSPGASPSPAISVSPTTSPSARPTATPPPTSEATAVTSAGPGASAAASTLPSTTLRRIEYVVQEDEALIKIAATFGVSRRQIILANEGMAEKKPYTVPGDVIIVPVSADLGAAEIEAVVGFVRFLE